MLGMTERTKRRLKLFGLALVAGLTLGACAMPDEKAAFEHVDTLVTERTNVRAVWHTTDESRSGAASEGRSLIAEPLTKDGAIKLAFLRNPAIQASLANIGISEADVAQAGRLKNPVISFERVATQGFVEITRQVLFSVLSLATLGARTEIAENEAEKTRYLTALEIVDVANQVMTAWVEAVAARERVAIMNRIFESASVANDLADRLAEAGNMTELDQAKIKAFFAETAAQRGNIRANAQMTRERLIRAMGVWGQDLGFALPGQLPQLPSEAKQFGDLERVAISNRLDIRAARSDVDAMRETRGLTGFTSVVNLLEASAISETEREREDGEWREINPLGFEVEFAIPIFDPGDAKRSRAKWVYMQSVEKLRSLAVIARSEVREAYVGYRSRLELAHHYIDTVVPLRARISDEELLRYNGMLASVFDLLAAVRQHSEALMFTLDSKRDFWLADGRMDAVLLSGSMGPAPIGAGAVVADAGAEEH